MGFLVAREARRAGTCTPAGEACATSDGSATAAVTRNSDWRAFSVTFGLLFVAELGDKTQLAVLTLATKYSSPWAVFAGGALALNLVTALGVLGGQGLCRIMPQRLLLWISAVAFVVMGLLMFLGIG